MIEFESHDTEEWQEKKEQAKNLAIEETKKNVREYVRHCQECVDEDSDSDGSDYLNNPYSEKQSIGNEDDKYPMNFIDRFFEALMYNWVFDSGFYMNNGRSICYCPCSRNVSNKWMNMLRISLPHSCSDQCKGAAFETPLDLINHLNSMGDRDAYQGFLHIGVATFLKSLYPSFFQKKKNRRRSGRSRRYHKESPHFQREKNQTSFDLHPRPFIAVPSTNDSTAKPESIAPTIDSTTGVAKEESSDPSSTACSAAKPELQDHDTKTATGKEVAKSIAEPTMAASEQHQKENKNSDNKSVSHHIEQIISNSREGSFLKGKLLACLTVLYGNGSYIENSYNGYNCKFTSFNIYFHTYYCILIVILLLNSSLDDFLESLIKELDGSLFKLTKKADRKKKILSDVRSFLKSPSLYVRKNVASDFPNVHEPDLKTEETEGAVLTAPTNTSITTNKETQKEELVIEKDDSVSLEIQNSKSNNDDDLELFSHETSDEGAVTDEESSMLQENQQLEHLNNKDIDVLAIKTIEEDLQVKDDCMLAKKLQKNLNAKVGHHKKTGDTKATGSDEPIANENDPTDPMLETKLGMEDVGGPVEDVGGEKSSTGDCPATSHQDEAIDNIATDPMVETTSKLEDVAASTEHSKTGNTVLDISYLKDPLSPATQKRIEKLINNKNAGDESEVVCQVGNNTVDMASFHTLKPDEFLNDEIINAYSSILKERDSMFCAKNKKPQSYFVMSYFMSKLQYHHGSNKYNYADVKKWLKNVDIFALNKLFIPCNELKHHWSLVVVDFIQKRI